MRGAASARRPPLVRLWPTLALVLLLVAPFPWGVMAEPASAPVAPPAVEAPVAEAAPAVAEPTPPEPVVLEPAPVALGWSDARSYAADEPKQTMRALVPEMTFNSTRYDMVLTTAAPRFVRLHTSTAAEYGVAFVDVVYSAESLAPPLATTWTLRTNAATVTGPMQHVYIAATPHSATPATSVQGSGSAPLTTVANPAAPAPAASTPSTPAPAPAPAASSAPSHFSGGVMDVLARMPPDLLARPHRLLRLLVRGGSLLGLVLLGHRSAALDQETRRRIYEYLRENPGALAGQIAESLGVRRQTVTYHLRVLIWENQVVSHANGRRHYFCRDDPKRVDNRHLLSPVTRNLFDMLPDAPVTAQELSERLGVTRRTVNWHLGRLRAYGLVHGLRARSGTRYVRATARGL